nr:methyltransferase [uncultured Niameybacter sp.]
MNKIQSTANDERHLEPGVDKWILYDKMDYENYMELYEAIYFLDRINGCTDNKLPKQLPQEEMKRLGLNESIYTAMVRILTVNNLLDYDGSSFIFTNKNKAKHRYILDNIISKSQNNHCLELFNRGINENQFFFHSINEAEYEIYSRYNFQMTFQIGKEVAKHINLTNMKVLELGGNSGGLGTALLTANKDCLYTIVDTKIPCKVGKELKHSTGVDITFIEGNVFELMLESKLYDYIILMNLLHDFDDECCLNILHNCLHYSSIHTKFLIIEDVLTDEFEPKEVIMHGLRLSVECRGGKQRTMGKLIDLFSNINYKPEKVVRLNNVHTMLVMGYCQD